MRTMAVGPVKHFAVLPAILVIAAATLAIGCFDKESKPKVTPDPFPGYLQPTSPENVIANLEKSWNDLNYNAYQPVLNDEFTYVFAPMDIGGPDNNPASWGRADELLSAQHLFSKTAANRDGYVANSVSLTFSVGPAIPNDLNGWTKIVLSQIFLTVTTHEQTTSDPLDYLVQGDQANLWFAQSGGTWTLVQWEDKPIGVLAPGGAAVLPAGVATQPSTWGQIKGLFR